MRHDPALQEAFDANRRAIALANFPENAILNFKAMSVGERRWAHWNAEAQAGRYDILASTDEALGRSPNYHRKLAADARRTAEALQAIGL